MNMNDFAQPLTLEGKSIQTHLTTKMNLQEQEVYQVTAAVQSMLVPVPVHLHRTQTLHRYNNLCNNFYLQIFSDLNSLSNRHSSKAFSCELVPGV